MKLVKFLSFGICALSMFALSACKERNKEEAKDQAQKAEQKTENAIDMVSENLNQAQKSIAEGADKLKDKSQKAFVATKEAAQDALDSAKDKVSDAKDAAHDAYNSARDKTHDVISSMKDDNTKPDIEVRAVEPSHDTVSSTRAPVVEVETK